MTDAPRRMTGTSRQACRLGDVEDALPSALQSMGCHPRDHVATAVQNHETITPHRAGLGKGQPQDSKEGFYCERVAFARRESHVASGPPAVPLRLLELGSQALLHLYARPGVTEEGTAGEPRFFRKTRSDFAGHLIA